MSETRDRLTLKPPANGMIADQMDHIREEVIMLGEVIEASTPKSREQSLALTKLEEVCFWAIAAVARSADNRPTPGGGSAPI